DKRTALEVSMSEYWSHHRRTACLASSGVTPVFITSTWNSSATACTGKYTSADGSARSRLTDARLRMASFRPSALTRTFVSSPIRINPARRVRLGSSGQYGAQADSPDVERTLLYCVLKLFLWSEE